MKKIVFRLLILTLLASCNGTADDKAPELANEMCGCFTSFQQSLSDNAKKIMKQVATAEKPQDVLMKRMQSLTPEEAKIFAEQLKKIGDKDSDIMKCLNEFDKKHAKETTADKKALTQKLLMELQKNGQCYVGAAIVNMNAR